MRVTDAKCAVRPVCSASLKCPCFMNVNLPNDATKQLREFASDRDIHWVLLAERDKRQMATSTASPTTPFLLSVVV